MALYLHLLGSPAVVNVSSTSAETSPTWINKLSNGMWQIVIIRPVLKEGRALCPCMVRLLCCAADSGELVSTETAVLDHKVFGQCFLQGSHVGSFPFSPDCLLVLQLLIPSHLFVKLFVFLCLLASSSSFCLLGIYRFPRSQSVLFFCYRSLPCSWLPLHSFSPRGLALSPSLLQLTFFYLLPTFSANAVLFLIPPSYWFSVFSFFLFFLEKFPFSFQFFSPSAFPVKWHHMKNQCKKQCAVGWGCTGGIRK